MGLSLQVNTFLRFTAKSVKLSRFDLGPINLQFQVKKLFIGDLKNKDLTAEDLEDYFGKFGRIKDAVIMEKDGVSRG